MLVEVSSRVSQLHTREGVVHAFLDHEVLMEGAFTAFMTDPLFPDQHIDFDFLYGEFDGDFALENSVRRAFRTRDVGLETGLFEIIDGLVGAREYVRGRLKTEELSPAVRSYSEHRRNLLTVRLRALGYVEDRVQ